MKFCFLLGGLIFYTKKFHSNMKHLFIQKGDKKNENKNT
jgi:hypothetical protein